MIENIVMLLLGLCCIILGITNLKGNDSTIHWYHRMKISQKNRTIYTKIIGIGTIIIGMSITITAMLQMIYEIENLYYISLIGIMIGIIIMIFAQIKYNIYFLSLSVL